MSYPIKFLLEKVDIVLVFSSMAINFRVKL
jgi:hypothetical protein